MSKEQEAPKEEAKKEVAELVLATKYAKAKNDDGKWSKSRKKEIKAETLIPISVVEKVNAGTKTNGVYYEVSTSGKKKSSK